jgi:cardiolipin synthase
VDTIRTILYVLYIALVAATSVVIVFDRREPAKALAWIIVVALIPVAGLALYVLFGRNHRKEKLFNRKEIRDLEHIERLSGKQLRSLQNRQSLQLPEVLVNQEIITLLLNNNKALLTVRNRVELLIDGQATFEAIIAALEGAKESIHLEYYIFENDAIGSRIGETLMRKAAEGVEVRLIYDDVGSWSLSRRYVQRMRRAGVDVRCFMPVVFPWLTSRVNYRNHRKIVVVDGRVGFTGGLNVADRYLVSGGRKRWHDTHLRIEGDAVMMLQTIFVTDWFFVGGRPQLDDSKYFPRHDVEDFLPMQIASSGPDSDWASIMQSYFSAITKARRHIYISSPYFMPDNAILTAIKVASLSGIDVRLLIPGSSDHKIVYWATCSYISELLAAGVKVYRYRRGFNHSKIIMIDGRLSSVGTANMDVRSFEDNFETSAFIYDPTLTAQLEELFLDDLRHSSRINAKRWNSRPVLRRFVEAFSSLFSPLL